MIAQKKTYWISTILLFSMMMVTGVLYFIYYETLVMYFERYGYPSYLIYPLGGLKIIGSIIILSNKYKLLIELAYAGFFFNFILAFFAHLMVGEFDPFPSISLILLIASYFTRSTMQT